MTVNRTIPATSGRARRTTTSRSAKPSGVVSKNPLPPRQRILRRFTKSRQKCESSGTSKTDPSNKPGVGSPWLPPRCGSLDLAGRCAPAGGEPSRKGHGATDAAAVEGPLCRRSHYVGCRQGQSGAGATDRGLNDRRLSDDADLHTLKSGANSPCAASPDRSCPLSRLPSRTRNAAGVIANQQIYRTSGFDRLRSDDAGTSLSCIDLRGLSNVLQIPNVTKFNMRNCPYTGTPPYNML